eukprot:9765873-Lingulodinium_polyedra.AAC.1
MRGVASMECVSGFAPKLPPRRSCLGVRSATFCPVVAPRVSRFPQSMPRASVNGQSAGVVRRAQTAQRRIQERAASLQ